MNNYTDIFRKQFIAGQWRESHSSERIAVENPATRNAIAEIPAGSPRDAEEAIEAAAAAFPKWSRTTTEERLSLMDNLLSRLKKVQDSIVEWESGELGTSLDYTRRKHCEYQLSRIPAYMNLVRQIDFESRRIKALVRIEPVGVIACLTPWNYPLGQIIQKIIPAILMGNTVVLKPSSLAPLTAVILAEAFREAGFPEGVFNLVNGRGRNFDGAFTTHPKVAMVSFTGSTETGRKLAVRATEQLKRTSLELGGKSPFVWLPGEKDYEPACHTLFNSVFLNAGQTCTSLSRLLVHESMLDDVKALFKRLLPEYKVGAPEDPEALVGPVICRDQYDRVSEYIRLGIEEGAELFAGKIPPAEPETGYFIEPCIFTNVKNDMRIAQEEIFGPVLCVITYRTIEEAIEIANGTRYGLSSAVYGEEEEAMRVAREIDAGNVFLNNSPRDITAPFGGFKDSGIGYESGIEGLLQFARFKSVFDGKLTK